MSIERWSDYRVTVRASRAVLIVACLLGASACATVRPEQRAMLADPTMQFDAQTSDRTALDHALENREASSGGGSVRGGGCGCN